MLARIKLWRESFVRVVWSCGSAWRGERMRVAGKSGVGAAEARSSMLMRAAVCVIVLIISGIRVL